MSDTHMIQTLLAAYAFGALDPDERLSVEQHLPRCAECRAALAELTELPAMLDLAGGTETPIQSPPASLEATVLAALPLNRRSSSRPRRSPRPHSRRVRVLAAGAAVGLILALVGVLLSQRLMQSTSGGERFAMTASAHDPAARAVVALHARPWGTEVILHAHGLAPTRGPQIYEVWFVSAHGRVSAGSFTVGPRGTVTVQLAVAAHADQYRTLGITREPNGLNPTRSGPNILRASLRT